MSKSVFPYPGGKTRHAPWILSHFPDHGCYVEAFGGSASVLVNKPRSTTEIYNDVDGDLVQFFEVLRDRPDELERWLEDTPYSRELHEQFATAYYGGDRPDDPVERAGQFFYLRRAQFAGKYRTKSGFSSSISTDHAGAYINSVRSLSNFAERFRGVVIESEDYSDLVEVYDTPETLFYFDPPYVDAGDACYAHGEFDHGRFVETVRSLEGYAIVSYGTLPGGLSDGMRVVERDSPRSMSSFGHGEERDATERLVMNFDPGDVRLFDGAAQCGLDDFSTGADHAE